MKFRSSIGPFDFSVRVAVCTFNKCRRKGLDNIIRWTGIIHIKAVSGLYAGVNMNV